MATYRLAKVPTDGDRIGYEQGVLRVPDKPILPYIEGDGTGADIWRASVRVFDAAVEKCFGGKKKVRWMEVYAGEKSFKANGEWLPQETIDAMQEFRVSIKGPLTTPVGGGIRSLNVALRQVLDLYACIRPVRYFEGVGNPMKEPEKLNVVIFRENTEDVYAGIEWAANSAEADKLRAFIKKEFNKDVREHSELGIKPIGFIKSYAYAAIDPFDQLLQGPVFALPVALERAKISLKDIGVIEMHEAFAAQVLSNIQWIGSKKIAKEKLGRSEPVGEIDPTAINRTGGSIALGHPFGATGARIVTTVCNELQRTGQQYGLVTVCAAGGIGVAMVLERE